MPRVGELPLVNFEKLQYGQHNVIDKAEAGRFGLLCMMQAPYMKQVFEVCATLESADIAQAISMLKAVSMRYRSGLASV